MSIIVNGFVVAGVSTGPGAVTRLIDLTDGENNVYILEVSPGEFKAFQSPGGVEPEISMNAFFAVLKAILAARGEEALENASNKGGYVK